MIPIANIFRLSRQLNIKSAQCASNLVRFKSSSQDKQNDLVLLNVNDKTGIATMTMNSMPVNSLSLELLTAMSKSFDELNKNNCRGMILSSVSEGIFHVLHT